MLHIAWQVCWVSMFLEVIEMQYFSVFTWFEFWLDCSPQTIYNFSWLQMYALHWCSTVDWVFLNFTLELIQRNNEDFFSSVNKWFCFFCFFFPAKISLIFGFQFVDFLLFLVLCSLGQHLHPTENLGVLNWQNIVRQHKIKEIGRLNDNYILWCSVISLANKGFDITHQCLQEIKIPTNRICRWCFIFYTYCQGYIKVCLWCGRCLSGWSEQHRWYEQWLLRVCHAWRSQTLVLQYYSFVLHILQAVANSNLMKKQRENSTNAKPCQQ